MYNTPSFRHPLIKGDEEELSELHVLEEFKTMGMLMDRQVKYAADKGKKRTLDQNVGSAAAKSVLDTTRENTPLI